ncbi:choline/carnitine O-acyltransferase, partial [Gordonia aichiensis]
MSAPQSTGPGDRPETAVVAPAPPSPRRPGPALLVAGAVTLVVVLVLGVAIGVVIGRNSAPAAVPVAAPPEAASYSTDTVRDACALVDTAPLIRWASAPRADTATALVSFDDFGTGAAKQLGISPDAFAQLAYQLAHRRSKGLTGATYESIATRQFRNGRTEAMRVVTPEMVAFVDAMVDDSADRADKLAAARTAASAHVGRAKECQAGQAPEQHLWELQWIQRRRGAELGVADERIALFDSPGWTIMRDDYLSTSSAPSVHIRYFGFGSTSP